MLRDALSALTRFNKGLMLRDQAAEHLRDLADHLEGGGYPPDIQFDPKTGTFTVGDEDEGTGSS